MPLTDAAIRAAKPGAKPIKLSDSLGLQLHISTANGRTWNLAFRYQGKQQKLRLGSYPLMTLSEARSARDAARKLLDQGVSPLEHRKQAAAEAASAKVVTFKEAADALITRKRDEGLSADTVAKAVWLLDFMIAEIGARPLREIRPSEILVALKRMEQRGRRDSAKRLRALTSAVFRLGIAHQQCDGDPAQSLIGATASPVVVSRAAVIEREAFGELLRCLDGYGGADETRAALQLLALTALRPGELRQGRWSEVDLEAKSWTIPAERMKGRKPHKISLAKQAIDILKELRLSSRSDLIFQGNGKSRSKIETLKPLPLSENTLNLALRRMGYSKEQMTAHGFRSSFSTMAAESQIWSVDIVESQLSHQDPSQIRRVYQRSTFWDERVKLAQWWADQCDAMRLLKPSKP